MTKETFTEVYNTYFEMVFHTSLGILHDRRESEDIAVEIFCKLWEGVEPDEMKYIKTYLYRAACTKSFNIQRRKELIKYRDYVPDIESEPPSDYIMEIRTGYMNVVLDRINKMPEQCAKVCKMSFIQGLENVEIAKVLNIALKTVCNQKIIGMGILKNKLKLR